MADAPKPEIKFTDRIGNAFKPARGDFGQAVKDGFKNMNVLDKDVPKGQAFAKLAGTGVGAYMLGDAVLRSKNSDGEQRGIVGRIVQGGVGLGVGTASVVAHLR